VNEATRTAPLLQLQYNRAAVTQRSPTDKRQLFFGERCGGRGLHSHWGAALCDCVSSHHSSNATMDKIVLVVHGNRDFLPIQF